MTNDQDETSAFTLTAREESALLDLYDWDSDEPYCRRMVSMQELERVGYVTHRAGQNGLIKSWHLTDAGAWTAHKIRELEHG